MINVMAENKIGRKLKKILIDKRLTQRDLYFAFREAGIKLSESAISNRIKGIVEFSEEQIKFLNKFLNEELKSD